MTDSKTEQMQDRNTEIIFAEISAPTAAHFALWVKEQLAEKYTDAVVEQGGLRVYTTLDIELQHYAQEEVAKEVANILEHYKDADPERAKLHAENVLTNEKVFQFLESQ